MQESLRPTEVLDLPAGRIEYRWDQHGGPTVLICHGGHLRAGIVLGEDLFTDAGYTVLVPSRPGYGRTPLPAGSSVADFTDLVAQLCERLGITHVAAVVGISAGGPSAVTMAARHPGLVARLILLSAVGWLPYPDRLIRAGAHVGFTATTERLTWAAIHTLARTAPQACLRLMLAGLSTRPIDTVLANLNADDRAVLLGLFSRMRSGRGFLNDLRPTPDVTAGVEQPTLVIGTRYDAGVPFSHSQSLAAAIRDAELFDSGADTHLAWLGPARDQVADPIHRFLTGR